VDLIESVAHEFSTDFPYRRTTISDTPMLLLDDFYNQKKVLTPFEALFTATYVISLGPYSISQSELDEHPGGVNVGFLCVILDDEEPLI